MIYFLRPEISGICGQIWNDFYDGAFEVLKKFKPHKVIKIETLEGILVSSLESDSLVIFFVPEEEPYELEVFLGDITDKGISVFPIAISKETRLPSERFKNKQSFDIITEKTLRGLDDNFIKLIGECFGREVVISYFPAFFNEKMNLFVSHRRLDGEEEACFFNSGVHHEKENAFIDLHVVRTGEDAQEEIEANLTEKSDILIFVQTKTSFESYYQLLELKKAFELGIPVLWLTLGLGNGDYKELPLHPAASPHFELDELTNVEITKVINYAFEMIKSKKQRLLENVIYKFDSLKNQGISYEELCDKENLYLIERTQNGAFGIEKNKLIFKCIFRDYKGEDLKGIISHSEKINSNSNTIYTNKGKAQELEHRTEIKRYSSLFDSTPYKSLDGKGVIISGSFPENLDLKYQHNIIDTISILIEEILKRNGKVIFGAHPTFQGLVIEKSKPYNLEGKRVHLYASKFFKNAYKANLEYFNKETNFIEIDKVEGSENDLSLSLTKMRKTMINDTEAIAMVVIGGKEAKDSYTDIPGVDEEIDLAKEREIPVFVLGSTGGRSSSLVRDGFITPIEDVKNNKLVTRGSNYRLISEIILESIISQKGKRDLYQH